MTFDPYHAWLGIRPEEQPPSHYRLLGLAQFEDNPAVIDSAADRQMAHVRTFQSGRHAGAAQFVLNEIAAARICLLDPASRREYDSRLREHLSVPLPPIVLAGSGQSEPLVSQAPAIAAAPQDVRSRPQRSLLVEAVKVVIGGMAGVMLSILLLRLVFQIDITGLLPIPPRRVTASRPKEEPVASKEEKQAKPSSDTDVSTVPPAVAAERLPPLSADARDHCVLLFAFDPGDFYSEGGEQKVRDRSGRGHHGLVEGAVPETGKAGMGLAFDGRDDYVQCADAAALNPSSELTVCAWAMPLAWVYPKDAADYIVSKDDWKQGARGFVLRFAAGGQADFTIGVGRIWSEVRDARKQPLRVWVHMAAVYDGHRKVVFVNGQEQASHPESRSIAASPFALRIGRGQFAPKRGFHGLLDEVAVFDVALPAEDVRAIYELGQAGTPLAE